MIGGQWVNFDRFRSSVGLFERLEFGEVHPGSTSSEPEGRFISKEPAIGHTPAICR